MKKFRLFRGKRFKKIDNSINHLFLKKLINENLKEEFLDRVKQIEKCRNKEIQTCQLCDIKKELEEILNPLPASSVKKEKEGIPLTLEITKNELSYYVQTKELIKFLEKPGTKIKPTSIKQLRYDILDPEYFADVEDFESAEYKKDADFFAEMANEDNLIDILCWFKDKKDETRTNRVLDRYIKDGDIKKIKPTLDQIYKEDKEKIYKLIANLHLRRGELQEARSVYPIGDFGKLNLEHCAKYSFSKENYFEHLLCLREVKNSHKIETSIKKIIDIIGYRQTLIIINEIPEFNIFLENIFQEYAANLIENERYSTAFKKGQEYGIKISKENIIKTGECIASDIAMNAISGHELSMMMRILKKYKRTDIVIGWKSVIEEHLHNFTWKEVGQVIGRMNWEFQQSKTKETQKKEKVIAA